MYFARPIAAAKMARQHPLRHIRLGSEGISVRIGERESTLPWTRFRFVWDVGGYLVLVLNPYAGLAIPKASMPVGAQQFIEQSIAT